MGDDILNPTFGKSFNPPISSSNRSSKAGYGTPLGVAAGRTPERQQEIDDRRARLAEERQRKKLEAGGGDEDEDDGDFIGKVDQRLAEEEQAKRDAEEKAKRDAEEKAKRDAEEKAKLDAEKKAMPDEAPPSPSPEAGAVPDQKTQQEARRELAERIDRAVKAEDTFALDKLREEALAEGSLTRLLEDEFDRYVKRQQESYGGDKLAARKDLSTRLRDAIRANDPDAEQKAYERGVNTGVVSREEAERFINREKTSRIPAAKSRPIAPDWRIHTRLWRKVNNTPSAGEQDRRLSPEAAAMRYRDLLAKKLAFDDPEAYAKAVLRDQKAKQELNEQGLDFADLTELAKTLGFSR